jgi:hypothetical protein
LSGSNPKAPGFAGGYLPVGTIGAGSNFTSAVIQADGFNNISAAVTSTQTGVLSIQRFMDVAGTIAQGSALTKTLAANTAETLNNTDNLIFRSFTVEVSNTAGSAATISNFAMLLMA